MVRVQHHYLRYRVDARDVFERVEPLDLPPTVHYARRIGGPEYEFIGMPRRPR